ncbi:MAG: hypothetical protein ABIS47_00430 [Acidimicrobiales bacterium]
MAASAALMVAVVGRGDLVFLGVLLALALAERRSSVAALLAVVAVSVRWGTTSAEAINGATTTLGPALRVGPPLAAAALALAATALLLAGLGSPLLVRLAVGATAGALAAGPVGGSSAGSAVVGLLAVVLGAALGAVLPRVLPKSSSGLRLAAPILAGGALAVAVVW